MAFNCKGICHRYKPDFITMTIGVNKELFRCTVCEMRLLKAGTFVNDKRRCNCCHTPVRIKPRLYGKRRPMLIEELKNG